MNSKGSIKSIARQIRKGKTQVNRWRAYNNHQVNRGSLEMRVEEEIAENCNFFFL